MSRQVLSGGLWTAASQLLPMAATTALSVVAARVLGPTDLGRQSLIAFVEAALGSLVVNSLTDATIVRLADTLGRADAVAAAHLRRWSFAGHAVVGAAAALMLVVVGLTTAHERLSWLVVAASVFVNAIGWGYASQVIAEQGWRPVSMRRLLAQLVGPLLGVGALLVGGGIAGIFLANVVAAIGLAWALRSLTPRSVDTRPLLLAGAATSRSRGRRRAPPGLVRLWMQFAILELFTQIVVRRVEFLVLGWSSTPAEIAMYSIPFMVVSAAGVVPMSISGAAVPAMAQAIGRGERERAETSLGWALRVTLVGSLALFAMLAALGPPLVSVVYGAEYERAAQLVPLAALALLLSPAGQLCAGYWAAMSLARPMLVAGAIAGVVDVGLALALVSDHGALGAVIANVVGQTVLGALMTWWTVRQLSGRPLHGCRWSAAALVSAAAAVAARLGSEALGGIAGLCGGAVLGIGVFAVLGSAIGLLSAEDAAVLNASLPGRLRPLVNRLVHRRRAERGAAAPSGR